MALPMLLNRRLIMAILLVIMMAPPIRTVQIAKLSHKANTTTSYIAVVILTKPVLMRKMVNLEDLTVSQDSESPESCLI